VRSGLRVTDRLGNANRATTNQIVAAADRTAAISYGQLWNINHTNVTNRVAMANSAVAVDVRILCVCQSFKLNSGPIYPHDMLLV
jgi:hypothetical protein